MAAPGSSLLPDPSLQGSTRAGEPDGAQVTRPAWAVSEVSLHSKGLVVLERAPGPEPTTPAQRPFFLPDLSQPFFPPLPSLYSPLPRANRTHPPPTPLPTLLIFLAPIEAASISDFILPWRGWTLGADRQGGMAREPSGPPFPHPAEDGVWLKPCWFPGRWVASGPDEAPSLPLLLPLLLVTLPPLREKATLPRPAPASPWRPSWWSAVNRKWRPLSTPMTSFG